MKLTSPVQHAVIDAVTGLALSLHETAAEAGLAVPRKPPYGYHPGFHVTRVLVTIEELAPTPPAHQLHLPISEAPHATHQ